MTASGILFEQTNYEKLLPAIKIDVFAVDCVYQKLHQNKESKLSTNPDDHYYFSDNILLHVIQKCYDISEQYIAVNYILLYADKKAERFYIRNLFEPFGEYMKSENNAEIKKNIPMFMKL